MGTPYTRSRTVDNGSRLEGGADASAAAFSPDAARTYLRALLREYIDRGSGRLRRVTVRAIHAPDAASDPCRGPMPFRAFVRDLTGTDPQGVPGV